jgi:hypothetical protein
MFVYTAYVDESGTHDGSPVTVMGCVLARTEQWRVFERKFASLQVKYGFKVWHTKKFKKKKGDFRGWSDEKCHDLYWSMQQATSFGLTDIISLTLNNASFVADYKAGDLPRKARLDTEYSLCFRICLVHLVREVLKRRRRGRVPPLHVVVEGGHRHFGDAERVFEEEKQIWKSAGVPILRSLTKADKDQCGALMIADFAAHSEFLMEKRELDTGVLRNRSAVDVPKGMTPSTHLQFTPEMLRKLRAEIVARAIPKGGNPYISQETEASATTVLPKHD